MSREEAPTVWNAPRAVIFYGLADDSLQEVVELFVSREEAERTLRDVLRDEPDWHEILVLVRVEFGYDEARVEEITARPSPHV